MITNCEIGISFSSLSLSVQFSIRILTWNVEFVHLLTFKILKLFFRVNRNGRSKLVLARALRGFVKFLKVLSYFNVIMREHENFDSEILLNETFNKFI